MDLWKQRWEERYSNEAYAYGEEPNLFFAAQLQQLKPGKILFAAEGEGRNAVFAAQLGWEVFAFDISEEGRKKALKLAAKKGVTIDYRVGALEELDFEPGSFDAVVLIYAHIPQPLRSKYQQLMASFLRQGSQVIVEGFSKDHLSYVLANEKVGGPKEEALLLSASELASDFAPCDIVISETREIELQEGSFHNGIGSVVRFVAVKK